MLPVSPPSLPPHKLKSTLREAGINLDKIAGSLADDAGVFAEGASKGSLGGALVLTVKEASEAREPSPTSACCFAMPASRA